VGWVVGCCLGGGGGGGGEFCSTCLESLKGADRRRLRLHTVGVPCIEHLPPPGLHYGWIQWLHSGGEGATCSLPQDQWRCRRCAIESLVRSHSVAIQS